MVDRLRNLLKSSPQVIFYAVLSFVLLSIVVVLFIDVADPGALRSQWVASGGYTPDELQLFFWFHWFEKPIENPLQWIFLGLTIAAFMMTAGAAYQRDDTPTLEFSILISAGMTLMLIEDVADPRHSLRTDLGNIFGEGGYGYVGTFVELGYFGFIGAVMLLALLVHRKAYWSFPRVRRFLLTGYVFYALAVGSSWVGSAFRSVRTDSEDIYTTVGQVICDFLFLDGAQTEEQYLHMQSLLHELHGEPMGFYFMDRVYEESLELIGASALLVAAIALFVATTDASNPPHQTTDSSSGRSSDSSSD